MTTHAFTITLSGKTCKHAGPLTGDAYKRANSYRCPVGPYPGRAFVLLSRKDAQTIASNASHTLKFAGSSGTVTIPNLYWVKDHRIGTGTGANGVQLIELADIRILACKWSDTGTYNANVRGGAIDYTSPYVAGAGESWQDAVDALWPSSLGAAPTLPYTPEGQPESQWHGQNAWLALHGLLDAIGCTTAYDPIAGTFSIVRRGASQTVNTGTANLEYDSQCIDGSKIDAPATVKTYFPTWSEQFGTEADLLTGGSNYLDGPPYDVETDTVDSGSPSGTVAPIWSWVPSEFSYEGTDRNSGERSNIGDQNVANLQADAATPRAIKRYTGAVASIRPGSQVKVVQWRHWGPQSGMVTEYMSHPGDPPKQTDGGGALELTADASMYPDFARAGYPTWPRDIQVVEIDHGTSAGSDVNANASGLHPGKIVYHTASGDTDGPNVWVRLINDFATSAGAVASTEGQQYIARVAGMAVHSGTKYPLYVANAGTEGGTSPDVYAYLAQRYAASATDRELVARWDETNTQLEATDETFSMLSYDSGDDDFDSASATNRSAVNLSPFDYNGYRISGNLHPFGAMAMQLGPSMFGLLPTMMDPSSLWFGIQCERTSSSPGPLRITQSASELYNQKLLTCNETNWTVAELLQCSGTSAASQPRWARLEKKSLWICPGMDVMIFYGAKFQCRTTLTEETTSTDSAHTHTYESPASFEIVLSLMEDYTGASGGITLPGYESDYSKLTSDAVATHVMHGVRLTECYETLTGFTVRRHTGETSGKTYGTMRRFDLGITTRMLGASTTYEAQWCDPMSAWMIAIPVRPSLIADVRRWRYDPYDDGAEPFQWYTYDISEPSQYDSDGA